MALKLLSISKSAIYFRPVKRVLVQRRQDLLTEFLGQQKSFRGVFFTGPSERKLYRKAATKASNPRPARPARHKASRRQHNAFSTRVGSSMSYEEEKQAEETMKEDIYFGDHRDFFILEDCYDLHKLLPSQVELLAEQWKRASTWWWQRLYAALVSRKWTDILIVMVIF